MSEKLYRMGLITATPEGDGMVIEGRAIVFNSPTVLFRDGGTEYKEQIARGALESADVKDCCLKYNHDSSVPILARCRGGSLELMTRDDGVDFRATLFNTQAARDCYELVRNGALQCSFAFTVKEEKYDRDKHLRTILKVDKLFDVSLVDDPAYPDTWVTARSKDWFEAEAERQYQAERRKRLLAKTYYI